MRQLMIILMTALFTGTAAAILWVALWTVVIPWEGYETFLTLVFVLAGLGGVAIAVRGFLS